MVGEVSSKLRLGLREGTFSGGVGTEGETMLETEGSELKCDSDFRRGPGHSILNFFGLLTPSSLS